MKPVAIATLLTVALAWSSATVAQRSPNLSQRVTWLEDKIEELEQRPEATAQLLDLFQRIERLEQEMRELRGSIETMNHEMESLSRRQRELYLDLDRRLQRLESGDVQMRPAVTARPVEPGPAPDGDTMVPGTGSSDPQAVRAEYDSAFRLLQEGRYPAAITAFEGYLERYPDGPLTDNAQYWLGEAYYVTREYRTALASFQQVPDRFPDSQKVPDALLKIGYVHYELQEWDRARAVLTEVVGRFPGTTIARLADQRLQRMRQEGR